MRKLVALGGVVLAAAVSATFAVAGGSHAARAPSIAEAVAKTETASSERFSIHVRLTRQGTPMALHIRGQASAHTVSVAMRMSVKLDDGTVVPGPNGAALLDGPFLYERVPGNNAFDGPVRWQRLSVAALDPGSPDLAAIRSMSPRPLLRMLEASHLVAAAGNKAVFHGWIGYDDRAARRLSKLTGELEFRHLHVSALVGSDGRVHRIVLTGRTADGVTTLSLRARLFAFGKPVHVTPPKPGTFMDELLAQMPV
jgi:hypothetical protein